MNKNYYEILEITVTAQNTEIKAAYRKLARQYHPDIAGNSAEATKKFKDITEAYETLIDKEKRKNYDTLRGFYSYGQTNKAYQNYTNDAKKQSKSDNNDNRKQNNQNFKEKSTQKNNQNQPKNTNREFSKAWETFVGGLNKEPKPKEEKIISKSGSDINTEITITIIEAINGTTKVLNILHTEPCTKCNGRKFINGGSCSVCNGKGEVTSHKKITLKIPPKVKNGSKIRLANEGNSGLNGGKNGDLYITVKIENDEEIKYDGLNVLKTIPITPFEAVLGGRIDVPVTGGTVTMKIMPYTANGQKYRIAGEGIQKDGKSGDMIVTIVIDIPKNLSEEEIELYKKLKSLSKQDLRENIYG